IREVQTAVNLEPFSSVNNARLSSMLFLARRYDEALAQSLRVLELDSLVPGPAGRGDLARAYLWLGRCAESLAALEGRPVFSAIFSGGLLGYAYARCGRRALADRYAIERELGHGGTATVYLAQDLKHGRAVAVKVLRPELAAALGAERFLREIEIAARLTHPHILPLHDSGEAAGFLYYV